MTIKHQLEFVEWLKAKKIYDKFATSYAMRQMQDIWENATKLSVVRAAIQADNWGIYSVPRPGRHCDVIALMRQKGYTGPVNGDRQGFLLSDGQFVTRDHALAIARQNRQLLHGTTISSTLTSEDMW